MISDHRDCLWLPTALAYRDGNVGWSVSWSTITDWNNSTAIGSIAIEFCTDIHGPTDLK